jgi:hypothetical protein
MSTDKSAADDREDAAFRARLAPLASEVLPRAPGAEAAGRLRLISRTGGGAEVESSPPASPTEAARAPRERPDRRAIWIVALIVIGISGGAGAGWIYVRSSHEPGASARTEAGTRGTAPPSGQTLGDKPARDATPTTVTQPASIPVPPSPPGASPVGSPVGSPAGSQVMIGLLSRRADAALAGGDIIAARLLYERAAALGSAAAATAAGKTYDLDFLLSAGARGIGADPAAAAAWYRKAAALGDPEASARLARILARSRP